MEEQKKTRWWHGLVKITDGVRIEHTKDSWWPIVTMLIVTHGEPDLLDASINFLNAAAKAVVV